jgi:hypothetical protein
MPHFSIKDLFVSTGLIACGLTGVVAVNHWMSGGQVRGLLVILLLLLYYASFVLIGSGVMLPFKKLSVGISIGVVLAILLIPYFFAG